MKHINKITIQLKSIVTVFLAFAMVSTGFISCSSDDKNDIINSVPEHEHDEISKIILKFIDPSDATIVREFSYAVDEGTTELPLTLVNIAAGTYNVETHFYSSEKELTDEIFIADADDHFVYFQKLNDSQISIEYASDDRIDVEGRKLGYKTTWTVPDGGGLIYLYLMHQPATKDPNAASAGQLGGEIDLEAHFNIETN